MEQAVSHPPPRTGESSVGNAKKGSAKALKTGNVAAGSTIDSIAAQLKPTHIAFNTPETILVGSTKEIQLIMDFGQIANADLADLKTRNGGNDSVHTATVDASELVAAKLSGDFEIKSLGPDTQVVAGTTKWAWSIKAASSGANKLFLNITSIVNLHGKEKAKGIATYSKDLVVISPAVVEPKVSIGQKLGDFFAKEWKWIWSAILVPVVGFLWSRRKKKDPDSKA